MNGFVEVRVKLPDGREESERREFTEEEYEARPFPAGFIGVRMERCLRQVAGKLSIRSGKEHQNEDS